MQCGFLVVCLLLHLGPALGDNTREKPSTKKRTQRRRLGGEGAQCHLSSFDCSEGLSCICENGRRLFGAPVSAVGSRSVHSQQCFCRHSPPGPPSPPPPAPPAPPPIVPVTQVIYSSGTTAYYTPSATGSVNLVAGATYLVQVEILRNDLGGGRGSEWVPAIYVGSTSIGDCAPDGGDYDCTFFTCPISHTFTPATSTVALSIDVSGHSWDCDCDMSSWQCSREDSILGRTKMTAVARYTFTPA